MKIQLKNLKPEETALFQIKMKEAFEQGLIDRLGSADAGPVPPEDEADHALSDESMDVFIITADGIPAGGTVIKREADGKYSLDLLFIFREFLNKKIGFAAWQAIENHYPDAEIWETCTPYFERRNIHFYLNKCGFQIVEFFSEYHREEHDITDEFKDIRFSGFFRFEKKMKR